MITSNTGRACFTLAICFCAAQLFAQQAPKERLEKSPRHLEWVKVKNGSREVNCFIGFPEVKEKATAVIVIHEIFGLSDWVRGVVDQLAEAGYIAIAPDLLSGAAPGGGGTADFPAGDAVRRAISSLPKDQITGDLNAVKDHVTKLSACNGQVAVGGFCWGGSETFRYAANGKGLKAAFVFYGSGPSAEDGVQSIACPVYGFYGGNDARVTSTVEKTAELMKKAGKKFEPVTYEDAGHGFMRAGEAPDSSEANKKARAEAWKRWKDLLKQ